jgi:hypothetical protein
VSQIFAAIMFVDDCGTKNPYQHSLSMTAAKLTAHQDFGQGNKF